MAYGAISTAMAVQDIAEIGTPKPWKPYEEVPY